MPDIRIHPSTLLVKFSYVIAVVLIAAIWLAGSRLWPDQYWHLTLLVIPLYILIRAAIRHIRCRLTRLEVVGDRLKYESGLFSKISRSMPLAKVQDVTISQSFGQRLLGLGNLSIETAGEQSRLVIQEISSPRQTAEAILNRVAHSGGAPPNIRKEIP